MDMSVSLENIPCPLCHGNRFDHFAQEGRYAAVKCADCGLVYVNPRPAAQHIDEAVKIGAHAEDVFGRTTKSRRVGGKVPYYRSIMASMLSDVWARKQPISWVDVGAGYGEFVEAVSALAPQGSDIFGIEPMKSKVAAAQSLGIDVREKYLSDLDDKIEFLSIINVFSHIPDFHEFLSEAKTVLKPGGEIILETGNIGDLRPGDKIPGELNLPDHLVFGGESTVRSFLERGGFDVVNVHRVRRDTVTAMAKNIVKKALGRPVDVFIPYTSKYYSMMVRARLA